MESIENIIKDLFKPATEADLLEDEYIGTDGLIYCKKCNTPRQAVWNIGDDKKYFKIGCKCILEQDEEERQEKEERLREKRRIDGIPIASYRNYRFENDDGQTPETTKIAKNYVENFEETKKDGWGLLLYGGVGTGKTFLAMCIANALIDKGYRVIQTTLSQVVQWARDWDNTEQHFNRLMNKDCIVIDDLGSEIADTDTASQTSFAAEKSFNFIDGCNVRKIPLIVTTNLSPGEFNKLTGESTQNINYARMYDRILQRTSKVKVSKIKRRKQDKEKNESRMDALLGIRKE